MTSYGDLMFTDEVLEAQRAQGSAGMYDLRYAEMSFEGLSADETDFLTRRSTFYIVSVSSNGWTYIQHCGGPDGFLQVLDPYSIGFADYRGNRQLITMGNLVGDDRVSVFAMDYARKVRLKLQGRARLISAGDDPDLAARLDCEGQGRVERMMTIAVTAFDWNCPQFITPVLTRLK